MKKDFEEKIIALAKESKDLKKYESSTQQNSLEDLKYIEALDHLFSISRQAVDIYNANSEVIMLNVYNLPKEFLEMFLEIPGRRGGFCIISPDKIVVFFDEDPNLITVIGKIRKADNNPSSRVNQLLKVSFSKKDDKCEYKDNTGGTLDPYDIVALLIKWVVA